MTAYASRSLMLSALLHGIILAVVFFFLMPARQEQAKLAPVFVMLPDAASSWPHAPDTTPTSLKPVIFTPPVVPVHVPTPLVEKTETTPETAAPPVHTPPARRPTATAPAKPEPVIAPSSASTHTTIAEFRKQHAVSPTQPPARRPTQARPTLINMDTVLTSPNTSSATPSAATVADAHEADAYLSRLLAKLRAAHQKPAGLDAGLRVRVEFSFRADGSLTGVRLLESSGDQEFDESVLAAFRKVTGLGVPPKALGQTNRVTFRTDAEG